MFLGILARLKDANALIAATAVDVTNFDVVSDLPHKQTRVFMISFRVFVCFGTFGLLQLLSVEIGITEQS